MAGITALDIGASTGGFTDYLLQNGAERVYSLDVGTNQLAWKIRNDPRVVATERMHIKDWRVPELPKPFDLCVIDVSFISLVQVLGYLLQKMAPVPILALYKPQFEIGREDPNFAGVVEDLDQIEAGLAQFEEALKPLGLEIRGQHFCQMRGSQGNQEVFLWLEPK